MAFHDDERSKTAWKKLFCNSKKRTGKWKREEVAYAERLIYDFENGLLERMPKTKTLRSWLADQLNCCPMRISKKFSGSLRIGKLDYIHREEALLAMEPEELATRDQEMRTLRKDLLSALRNSQRIARVRDENRARKKQRLNKEMMTMTTKKKKHTARPTWPTSLTPIPFQEKVKNTHEESIPLEITFPLDVFAGDDCCITNSRDSLKEEVMGSTAVDDLLDAIIELSPPTVDAGWWY